MWEKVLKEETEYYSLEEYESNSPQRLFEQLDTLTKDGDELAHLMFSEIVRMLPYYKVQKMLRNIMAELNNPERGSNF